MSTILSSINKSNCVGFPKIRDTCGQMIAEKLSLSRKMPHDWLQQQVDCYSSVNGIPYAGLMSSLATFKNHIMICDTGTRNF